MIIEKTREFSELQPATVCSLRSDDDDDDDETLLTCQQYFHIHVYCLFHGCIQALHKKPITMYNVFGLIVGSN